MTNFTDSISRMKRFSFHKPASIYEISNAENILELEFSKEYKEYLSKFGCASIYGKEFTGICDNSRLNVVDITLEERNFDQTVSRKWYVVEQLHIDGLCIWQDNEGSVFLKAPHTEAKKVADSLTEYLEQDL